MIRGKYNKQTAIALHKKLARLGIDVELDEEEEENPKAASLEILLDYHRQEGLYTAL